MRISTRPKYNTQIPPPPLTCAMAPPPPAPPSPSLSLSSRLLCHRHSPSETLDILILILVLFSGTFLLSSYLSYILHSLSLLSLPLLPFSLLLLLLIPFSLLLLLPRRRRCPNPSCKRLKKAMEFDLQIQNEECVKGGGDAVREVDALPWKSGCREDYECLTEELKKMAPVNGRAVLLFRAKCGCPLAKLEGWGPKRTRKHKKKNLKNQY